MEAAATCATAHRADYKSYQRVKTKLQCRLSALAEAAWGLCGLDDLVRQTDESLSMAAAVAKASIMSNHLARPARTVSYYTSGPLDFSAQQLAIPFAGVL